MQIMKHLITTVGEPKMKGGEGGAGGRRGEGRTKEDCKTAKQQEKEGYMGGEGGRGRKVRGQGEAESESRK